MGHQLKGHFFGMFSKRMRDTLQSRLSVSITDYKVHKSSGRNFVRVWKVNTPRGAKSSFHTSLYIREKLVGPSLATK